MDIRNACSRFQTNFIKKKLLFLVLFEKFLFLSKEIKRRRKEDRKGEPSEGKTTLKLLGKWRKVYKHFTHVNYCCSCNLQLKQNKV